MNRDTLRAMLKALPDVKEDGNNVMFDPGNWEVTLHAGRSGGEMQVQQITRITLESEYLVIETQRGRRVVLLTDEVRGLVAEPANGDRKGRKAGFA